jgi:hypothetical protein
MSPLVQSELSLPTATVFPSVAVRSDLTVEPLNSPPLSIRTLSMVFRSCDATSTRLSERIVVRSPSVTREVPVSVDVVSASEPLTAPPAPPRVLNSACDCS